MGQVPEHPGQGRLDLLPICLLVHVFWGTKGFLPPPYRVGQGVFGVLGVPALCFGKSCFSAPSPDSSPLCSIPGRPSKGSAIQLPGKVFTHFQDWNMDLYSRDRQQRSLSSYYCHSFFDAITSGGCWPVGPSPKMCTPTPCPSAAEAPSAGKGGFDWSTAPGTGGITDAP